MKASEIIKQILKDAISNLTSSVEAEEILHQLIDSYSECVKKEYEIEDKEK